MNPELLKKCLSGNASDSEWETYLEWISGEAMEDDLPAMPEADKEIKERNWNNIIAQNKRYHLLQKRRNWFAGTGIAAALLCIGYFSFFFNQQTALQHMQVFRYNAHSPVTENRFNGIKVQLAKGSEVSLKQVYEDNIDLNFSGAVMLSNTDSEDQYIVVKPHNNTTASSRKICLRKGHSYFLSYFNFEHQELIMVDKQRLPDMPPAIAMNMRQSFNL